MSADDILLDRDLAALLRRAVNAISYPDRFTRADNQEVTDGLSGYADRIDPLSDEDEPYTRSEDFDDMDKAFL